MYYLRVLTSAALALGLACLPASALTPNYSTDFESFTLGSVDGQDGWQGYTTDTAVGPPAIVVDPTSSARGNVLAFDPQTNDKLQGAFLPTEDLVAGGLTNISVSWDQFRADLGENVWIAEDISYSGWYGVEWDISGSVHPQGFTDTSGQVALQPQAWQTVRLDFDFAAKTIEAFVNGTSGGVKPFAANYTQFRGFDIELQETAVEGNGPLYIDNVRLTSSGAVIPEPGTMALMAMGALPLLGLRRRKA